MASIAKDYQVNNGRFEMVKECRKEVMDNSMTLRLESVTVLLMLSERKIAGDRKRHLYISVPSAP